MVLAARAEGPNGGNVLPKCQSGLGMGPKEDFNQRKDSKDNINNPHCAIALRRGGQRAEG